MNHLKCSIPPPDIGGLYFLIQNKSKRAVKVFSSPFLLLFDTFSRTADQCENGIAVYCFSLKLPQKAKKRVQNNVLDPFNDFSNSVLPFHIAVPFFDFSST